MMGPFERLAIHWTPAIEYRDYPANEVEDIAWESTMTASKRGFLVGFLIGSLLIGLVIAGVTLTGLYRPSPVAVAPVEAPEETVASRAVSQEFKALQEENQTLKRQVMEAKTAAACPPCAPQAAEKEQPRARTAAPPSEPSKPVATKTAPPREPSKPVATKTAPPREPSKPVATKTAPPQKASAAVADDQAAQPIPSNCRKPGDCDFPPARATKVR
jgi:hypothetical protein